MNYIDNLKLICELSQFSCTSVSFQGLRPKKTVRPSVLKWARPDTDLAVSKLTAIKILWNRNKASAKLIIEIVKMIQLPPRRSNLSFRKTISCKGRLLVRRVQ